MNETSTKPRSSACIILSFSAWLLLAISIGGLTSCDRLNASTHNAMAATPTPIAKDVIGLTEAELRAKYPDVTELDRSFDLLVSKNLHPYKLPATNKLLRFGRNYLVAELKNGRVIALHRVHG
jgi:hypothetical protein